MFKLIALLITIAIMAYIAVHLDFIGSSPSVTNSGAGGTSQTQTSPSGAIQRAQNSTDQFNQRVNQQEQQVQNQLNP